MEGKGLKRIRYSAAFTLLPSLSLTLRISTPAQNNAPPPIANRSTS